MSGSKQLDFFDARDVHPTEFGHAMILSLDDLALMGGLEDAIPLGLFASASSLFWSRRAEYFYEHGFSPRKRLLGRN